MAVNTRWAMKKVCDQAINDIERAQVNLANLICTYQEFHPDIATVFKLAFDCLEPIKPLIFQQREKI